MFYSSFISLFLVYLQCEALIPVATIVIGVVPVTHIGCNLCDMCNSLTVLLGLYSVSTFWLSLANKNFISILYFNSVVSFILDIYMRHFTSVMYNSFQSCILHISPVDVISDSISVLWTSYLTSYQSMWDVISDSISVL